MNVADFDPELVDLAAAVADGTISDWGDAERSAPDERTRALIARLRAIDEIARLHGTLSEPESGQTPFDFRHEAAPATWGGLRIVELIGSGRFGEVYRAFDPGLHREVALKLLRESPSRSDSGDQVVHEGRLAARVRHPNVVTIYGAQRINGRAGLWMELVEGRTLEDELCQRGPFPADEVAHIGRELCHALGAVHDAGLVHRDVKSTNVLREVGGRIVLGDFGTGRELDEPDVERIGLAGTPQFLAPEIFEHQPATPQSDLYSLGALLFRLATGEYPVPGRSLREIRASHTSGERLRARDLQPRLPSAIATTIDRALDASPARRFPNARAMALALQPAARGWRIPALIAACAALALVVGVFTTKSWWRGSSLSFPSRGWLLVVPVANRTGQAIFDGTLETTLERELASSSFVNVITRERLTDSLILMGKPVSSSVDEALALELARRDDGIKALVTGSIERGEVGFRLTAQIVNSTTRRPVATFEQTAANDSEVQAKLQTVSWQIREALGESSNSIDADRRERGRTPGPSLRAMQSYSKAAALMSARPPRPDEAESLLRTALDEESRFAEALVLLGTALVAQKRRRTDELPLADRALTLAPDLPVRERNLVAAYFHDWRGRAATPFDRSELVAAVTAGEALLKLQPDRLRALQILHGSYVALGRGRDADDMTVRIATVRPNSFQRNFDAAQILLRRGEVPAALRHNARAATALATGEIRPDALNAAAVRVFEATAAWLWRDARETLRIVDGLAAAFNQVPSEEQVAYADYLTNLYLSLGRLDQAEDAAALIPPSTNSRNHKRATVLVERGDLDGLRDHMLGDYRELTGRIDPQRVRFLIRVGLLEEAERDFAASNPTFQTADLRAELLLARGRPEDAILLLQQAGTSAGQTLSQAWEATGNLPKAIEALEAFLTTRSEFAAERGSGRPTGLAWIRGRAALLRLYRLSGRDARAIESELGTLLAVADRDHPVLQLLKGHSK